MAMVNPGGTRSKARSARWAEPDVQAKKVEEIAIESAGSQRTRVIRPGSPPATGSVQTELPQEPVEARIGAQRLEEYGGGNHPCHGVVALEQLLQVGERLVRTPQLGARLRH